MFCKYSLSKESKYFPAHRGLLVLRYTFNFFKPLVIGHEIFTYPSFATNLVIFTDIFYIFKNNLFVFIVHN